MSSHNIRKEVEFKEFINLLSDETVIAHWSRIAEVIGVNKDTITEWKKTPEAQEAIRKGIKEAMEGMRTAGKRDWRMWESKLKMLGVMPVERHEHTGADGKDLLPQPILGGTSSENKGTDTEVQQGV